MFSRSLRWLLFAALLVLANVANASPQLRELKVCADPDNLPFSNRAQQGYENKIAQLIAADLQMQINYVWQRMGRGFVREFMTNGRCDVVLGIPVNFRPLLTTAPYYRSTYMFVTRSDAKFQPVSLDDQGLKQTRIGVQSLDEEYTPPGEALARRGLQTQIHAFQLGADTSNIVDAIRDDQVGTAIIWGPLAGFLVKQSHDELRMTPVRPEIDPPGLAFTFAISMGVRKGNTELQSELNNFLATHREDMRAILKSYGVPLLENSEITRASAKAVD